jgi:dienelactone hydrolase
MNTFSPETCHANLLQTTQPTLAFTGQADMAAWRQQVDETLRELIGILPQPVPLNMRTEYDCETELFREIRFVFSAEAGADVPCHLLLPHTRQGSLPVVICLQGHTTGLHLSMGRTKYEGDEALVREGDRDFALQAVGRGYAALVLEQRCFGERFDNLVKSAVPFPTIISSGLACRHASMTALLLGRTMLGERVWDVSRAIDALEEFPEVDTQRIACMGNSGGGTTSYYAACLDERIGVVMPSCSISTFRASLGAVDGCDDNYLPGILRYVEMGDLAGLIAPRPLIIVAGRDDPVFPLAGAQEAFETIQRIYQAAGAPGNCRLVVGPAGHRFYADLAWPVFQELAGW